MMVQEQNKEISEARKSQVGSGDRSERIRTYNFPQGRVSEHRIGLTLYRLNAILDGDLDEIIDALITNDQAEKMKRIFNGRKIFGLPFLLCAVGLRILSGRALLSAEAVHSENFSAYCTI